MDGIHRGWNYQNDEFWKFGRMEKIFQSQIEGSDYSLDENKH